MSDEDKNATFGQKKCADENTQLSEEALSNVAGGLVVLPSFSEMLATLTVSILTIHVPTKSAN